MELKKWWMGRAKQEIENIVPKAREYGSNSLAQIGHKVAQLQGRDVGEEEALELGCWIYAVGKMERWTDAVLKGHRPSADTLMDLGVYSKMAIRIAESGTWPGPIDEPDPDEKMGIDLTGYVEVTNQADVAEGFRRFAPPPGSVFGTVRLRRDEDAGITTKIVEGSNPDL